MGKVIKMGKAVSTVMFISDLHVGKKTPTYDMEVFERRMKQFFNQFEEFKTTVNKSYKMPDLHIVLLGDMLDGEDIYPGQAFDLDVDLEEAMDKSLDILSAFVVSLLDRFEEVHIYGVIGNHGRSNWRGRANWDSIFYKRLQDRFSLIDGIYFDVGGWFKNIKVRNTRILAIHGDQINMYQNIPIYGIVQKAMRWYSGGMDEQFDIVAMGHFHTTFSFDWNNLMLLCNGTFLTDDDYTRKLGMKAQTKFWVLGISNDGVELMHQIEVE